MQYGATGVRPMTGKNMRGMAFVDFGDAAAAQTAFQQLDRLVINDLHKGLKVEYALQKGSAASSSSSSNQQHQNTPAKNKEPAPRTMAPSETPGTPIAPELGVSYASNPQLIYRYPDPTPEIIHNMANAIATVPRLYIQVLHLMNKMNLPPPFDDLPASAEPGILKRARDDLVASDESELESDDDHQKREDQQRAKLRRMTVQEQRQAMQKRG
ncbi:hypothetical protein BC940DRAFT_319395 [Gongronella butleri]|nr:hypothetical protein BC940DRAFT_319395 [Gongronella butleri]